MVENELKKGGGIGLVPDFFGTKIHKELGTA